MQSFRRLTASPAIRPLARSPTASPRQFVRRLTQNSGQGGSYASTGRTHGNMGAKGSDIPWMIGSIAFTVPATFYLLSNSSKPAHHPPAGHGHATATTKAEDSDAAGMTSEEEEGSSSDDAEATKQLESTDPKNQDTEEATSDARDQAHEAAGEMGEKAGELYGEAKNKAETSVHGVTDAAAAVKEKVDNSSGGKDTSEDELEGGGKKAEEAKGGVEKKEKKEGKINEDEGKEPADEKKGVEKDSKRTGETKSQTLERLNKEQSEKRPSDIDHPAAGMKGPTSTNMQSGKQEGLSNQDTWHAVLHSERGQAISKKVEGAHETAKLKGTVDPFRPGERDAAKK